MYYTNILHSYILGLPLFFCAKKDFVASENNFWYVFLTDDCISDAC